VFTEIIGYQQAVAEITESEEHSKYKKGFESEEEDNDELGVQGMT
jgi:hypothetical protein